MPRTLKRTAVTPIERRVRVIDSPLGSIALVGWCGYLRELHFDPGARGEGLVQIGQESARPPCNRTGGSRPAGVRQMGSPPLGSQGTSEDFAWLDREHAVALLDVDTSERQRSGHRLAGHRLALEADPGPMEWDSRDPLLLQAEEELAEYFAGTRRVFRVPIQLAGTSFQQRVWDHLRSISYGETCTYGELAARIGSPTASRAVGAALGKNPVGIFVPCHRVIGSTGKLVGFAGGIDVKRRLLELERSIPPE
jgi:methylated-DNA-[protein]-cysteine S-methyltransferase